MRSIAIIAVFAGVFVTGCVIPWPRSGSVLAVPETRGRVLDSATSTPVRDAHIVVDGRTEATAITKEDGLFHLREVRKKHAIECIGPGGVAGYLPPAGRIIWRLAVTHPDYQEKEVYLGRNTDRNRYSTNETSAIDVGDVMLTRKDK